MKRFKALWNGIELELSEEEYNIAMSHIEHMRQTAADNNFYEDFEDGDEGSLDNEGWKLSDTLDLALQDAKSESKWKGLSDAALVRRGLTKLAEELTILDPCGDDGADDVFQIG